MRNVFFLYATLFFIASCKIQPDSNRDNDKFNPNKTYKLQLNPASASSYYYDITSESESELELDDKKTSNENKTTVGVNYSINKDSAGNMLMTMVYDKVHLYTKNGDTETEADAANAAVSINPVERMLGIFRGTKIVSTISPSGELLNISGYKEMGEKMLAAFAPDDINGKAIAQSQWEKLIAKGMVKNNIEQLFKIFPDSAVHIGDTWRLSSKQEGEIPIIVKSTYTLKTINDDIAIIEAKGDISTDNNATSMLIPGGTATELGGEQQAEFEMETKTGMLISCRIKTNIEGSIQAMGRKIPLTIKTSLKVKGRRLTEGSH